MLLMRVVEERLLLIMLEHIADISSRLVVNKAAMRTRNSAIETVIASLAEAISKSER